MKKGEKAVTLSELPVSRVFAVLRPNEETPILAKDKDGKVRKYSTWELFLDFEIMPDAEV